MERSRGPSSRMVVYTHCSVLREPDVRSVCCVYFRLVGLNAPRRCCFICRCCCTHPARAISLMILKSKRSRWRTNARRETAPCVQPSQHPKSTSIRRSIEMCQESDKRKRKHTNASNRFDWDTSMLYQSLVLEGLNFPAFRFCSDSRLPNHLKLPMLFVSVKPPQRNRKAFGGRRGSSATSPLSGSSPTPATCEVKPRESLPSRALPVLISVHIVSISRLWAPLLVCCS